jgi:transposase
MIQVELAKWRQTVEDLRLASLNQTHPRSRERFQALYLIASGQFNATTCAAHMGRQDETVLRWVHLYNRHGPDALAYRHTGGRSPLLLSSRQNSSLKPWKTRIPPRRACLATTGP